MPKIKIVVQIIYYLLICEFTIVCCTILDFSMK